MGRNQSGRSKREYLSKMGTHLGLNCLSVVHVGALTVYPDSLMYPGC